MRTPIQPPKLTSAKPSSAKVDTRGSCSERLAPADAYTFNLPALDLLDHVRKRVEHERHLTAQEIGSRLGRAPVWHVVQVDARLLVRDQPREVQARAGAVRSNAQRPSLGLRVRVARMARSTGSIWRYTDMARLLPKFHVAEPPRTTADTCCPSFCSTTGRHGTKRKPKPSSRIAKRPLASWMLRR